MRVLIVGAGGMLGHKVWEIFRDRFDCRAAVRTRLPLAAWAVAAAVIAAALWLMLDQYFDPRRPPTSSGSR